MMSVYEVEFQMEGSLIFYTGDVMDNIKFVFFDIGYTLVDETLIWEQQI